MRAHEAARYLGISRGMVYRLVKERKVRCFKPNHKTLYFRRVDLDEYILRHPIEPRREEDGAGE